MGDNQNICTGGFKENSWLWKKGNTTSRMVSCRDNQSSERKKEAKEQMKRQSTGNKSPQLSVQEDQKKRQEG